MKKTKRMIILFFIMILIGSSMTVFAAEKKLTVYPEKQQKSQWCWAANARMLSTYYMGTSSVYTQTKIVTHVKGSAVNKPGTDAEIVKAIKYATGSKYQIPGISKMNMSVIKGHIGYKQPLAIRMAKTSDTSNGHMLFASGYNDSSNKLYAYDCGGNTSKWYTMSTFGTGTSVNGVSRKYSRHWWVNKIG